MRHILCHIDYEELRASYPNNLFCSLSSDVRRVIGQALCLESSDLYYVQDHLSRDPLIHLWTKGDISSIPLYRWRHIRDYSLRIDDGRYGTPCLLLALDHANNTRTEDVTNATLEYWIRQERVIAAGPLYEPKVEKNDALRPLGELILFNAVDREGGIEFCENMPSAQEGWYHSMRMHFYNQLDITGKFVSKNPLETNSDDMKEAMEIWGYPVDDDQTPWLNF